MFFLFLTSHCAYMYAGHAIYAT